MIAYIEGQVLFLEGGYVVVKPGGVGYQVFMSKRDLEILNVGQSLALFTYTHIREDAFELYGFTTPIHRQIFLLLISVSGVGPKLALAILSTLAPHELINAIINKDITSLSHVPGIGKKTAERLSLELREKALKIDCGSCAEFSREGSVRASLEQAIKSLGYSKAQSDKAVLALDQGDLAALPLEVLIKKTLQVLLGNKP